MQVPNCTTDPNEWFKFFDLEGNAKLSRAEVISALVNSFNVDAQKLEEALPRLWEKWDLNGSGFVTKSEFFDKDGGLLQFVRSRLLDLDSEPPPVRAQRSWNLDPGQWFAYFDDNKSGKLTRAQLIRALVKTNALLNPTSATEIINRLELVPPGNGETITLDAFLSIHQILLGATQQTADSQLDRLMQRLEIRGTSVSREDARQELAAQGGHIGRTINRLNFRQEREAREARGRVPVPPGAHAIPPASRAPPGGASTYPGATQVGFGNVPSYPTPSVAPAAPAVPVGIVTVQCGACRQLFGVPMGTRIGACAHCGAHNQLPELPNQHI